MRAVLTIAGSDSSGGAGIQADLKTFAAFGVYGAAAVTSVTAQNTLEIADAFDLDPESVVAQIETVSRDLTIAAVKTGMLAQEAIVVATAEAITRLGLPNVVVDPVLAAGNRGARTLLAPSAVSTMAARLLPQARLVTPNIREAEWLSGISIGSLADARTAARKIADLGGTAVVVKGGHLTGPESVDLLWDGRALIELAAPRIDAGPVHGTGCTFASAIAAGLALGNDLRTAVEHAKDYITGAIEHAAAVGHGARVLNHFWRFKLEG
jgi:hydroxymethylpyrimidine/phosphomethylpyrimidine kinase